jgi:hypothetical protein
MWLSLSSEGRERVRVTEFFEDASQMGGLIGGCLLIKKCAILPQKKEEKNARLRADVSD